MKYSQVMLTHSLFLHLSLCFRPFTGETGIGKSTLMNTLFNTMFENEEASHYQNGVYLRPRTYDLQETNVRLKLTIVDTVGFGDQINKEDRWAKCTYMQPRVPHKVSRPACYPMVQWSLNWPTTKGTMGNQQQKLTMVITNTSLHYPISQKQK